MYVSALARRVFSKHAPHAPRVRPLSGCYSTRRVALCAHAGARPRVSLHVIGRLLGECYSTAELRAVSTLAHVASCHWAPSRQVLQYPPRVHPLSGCYSTRRVCALSALPCAPWLCHAHQPCTVMENHLSLKYPPR